MTTYYYRFYKTKMDILVIVKFFWNQMMIFNKTLVYLFSACLVPYLKGSSFLSFAEYEPTYILGNGIVAPIFDAEQSSEI